MQATQPLQTETLLATIPLFSNLGSEDLSRIAQETRLVEVRKHCFLFHKGDECNGLYLIVRGQVKLLLSSAFGNEKVAEILGEGETVGEAQMFADEPYMVSAQATCESLLLHCPKALVFREIDCRPDSRLRMLAGMSMRLHQLMMEIETLSFHSGSQRVIGYLLRELPAGAAGKDALVSLPATKGNIASRLKMTHEHFCRILSDLSRRDLLIVDGGNVAIPDVDRLRAYQGQPGLLLYGR